MLCLAIFLLQSVAEREVEGAQQGTTFVIRTGGGGQGDIQTAQRIDFVVIDFREDDLLFHTHAVVATTVEGLGIQAAEVTHARQGDGQQTIQELVHAITAQGNLDADRPTFTNLEACNGFAGVGHDGFLASDLFQVGYSVLDDFLVTDRFAQTHVQGDFGDARNFHHVRKLKLFLQLRRDFFPVNLLQSCHGYLPSSSQASTGFWVDLKTRIFLPSSTLKPTRSALLVSPLKMATLERCRGASRSTIPPWTPAMGLGLVWRL